MAAATPINNAGEGQWPVSANSHRMTNEGVR